MTSSEQHSSSMRASEGAVPWTSLDDDEALSIARATMSALPSVTLLQEDGPGRSLYGAAGAAGKLVLAFLPWMRRASAS